jgi:hypothetical protein
MQIKHILKPELKVIYSLNILHHLIKKKYVKLSKHSARSVFGWVALGGTVFLCNLMFHSFITGFSIVCYP